MKCYAAQQSVYPIPGKVRRTAFVAVQVSVLPSRREQRQRDDSWGVVFDSFFLSGMEFPLCRI
ncbi:MAG: hypothetical protein L0287_15155 [Anaerolineae bacterium]|nr:hypothetical protein [Anaerolineae bacterium]MCI0610324.1 hypothetical protein [Anaerolineae bacterium]